MKRIKRLVIGIGLCLGLLVSNTGVAHAQINTGYTNWDRAVPNMPAGEWFTFNNQPMKMILEAYPYGYLTGLCLEWGARWDGEHTSSFTVTGAVEGSVAFYAMDQNFTCRRDLPVRMEFVSVDILAIYQDDNGARYVCTTSSFASHSNYVFTRKDHPDCSPYTNQWPYVIWAPGLYWMQVVPHYRFDGSWPMYDDWNIRTWAARNNET